MPIQRSKNTSEQALLKSMRLLGQININSTIEQLRPATIGVTELERKDAAALPTPECQKAKASPHVIDCSHIYNGQAETILPRLASGSVDLIFTSPPYNIGKAYVWVTKSDEYHFDLDAIRVPQKYPGKRHFKGPKKGQLSGNPGDVWDIPNVKHNHPEKTAHPCQFPEALVDRFVRALTVPGDVVLDPFAGAGTVGAVYNRNGRRSILIEKESAYVQIARQRLGLTANPSKNHEGGDA